MQGKRVLYVASTASHLQRFHQPYIAAFAEKNEVFTMANGENVTYSVGFEKRLLSLKNLKNIIAIRKILRRGQFDLMVLNTALAATLVRAAMLGWRKRPYTVYVVHGYLFSLPLRSLRERIYWMCERFMRCKTDEIVVMNDEDLAITRCHRLCRGSVRKIRGMGIDWSACLHRDVDLREQLGVGKDALLCLYVGELSRRKNQIFLIRAAERVHREGIPIRLILLGDGEEHQRLSQEIFRLGAGDYVFLTGNVEPVAPYLAAADLYLSASQSEGLPFNVMEAMLMGLPIVASDVKGQRDLLQGSDAVLYGANDLDALCKEIRRAYEEGRLGVGAVCYKNIEKYRLSAVFARNFEILQGDFGRA